MIEVTAHVNMRLLPFLQKGGRIVQSVSLSGPCAKDRRHVSFSDSGWGPAHLVGEHVMFVGLLVSLLTVVLGPALRTHAFSPTP